MNQLVNKKNVFYWALYDFANSIAMVVFFLYFAQWMVIDKGVADIWFNVTLAGASLLVLLTAPIAGIIADKRGTLMPFLRAVTLLTILTLIGAAVFAAISFKSLPVLLLAIIFFLLAQYFYQLSFTYYNSMLFSLAPLRLRGFVSGIGQGANYLGTMVGLLATLPFVGGAIYLFGESGRAQAFLPATLLFALFSLPMLVLFKESGKPTEYKLTLNAIKTEYKNVISSFKLLLQSPGLGRFLLAYFFFNDAVLTGVNNFPLYLEQVFHISDSQKSLMLVGVLATSAIGALLIGWTANKVGLKKMLLIILAGWTVTLPLMAVTADIRWFTVLIVALGILYGATWTVTRAVMTYLSPPSKLTEAFSYYTLYERFATFLGPVSWGLIVSVLFANAGGLRYRIALGSMTLFIIVGIIIARKIPAKPATTE